MMSDDLLCETFLLFSLAHININININISTDVYNKILLH